MLSLQRRHSRWRLLSILLFFEIICSGESAPTGIPEDTSSASPKKKDIGSLNDYWQAWILVDAQSSLQSGMDSTLLRRITPKSVFIAPVLPACAEGYHADKMGRCVKSISINATAHKDFILERLKIMFGDSNNDKKKSTGPLQLNIPLNINGQSSTEFDEKSSAKEPVAMPICNKPHCMENEKQTKPHETDLYEVKNNGSLDEQKSFFLQSSTIDTGEVIRVSSTTVSIVDSIKEETDDNISEVVDYKIPVNLKMLLNSSSLKINASDGTEGSLSLVEKQENATEAPAVVLLISPTKLTNVVDDSSAQNDTQIVSNLASRITTKENGSNETTESTVFPPAKQQTSNLDEQRDNETYAEDETTPEISKPNESQETDFIYDEEDDDLDYPYSTDIPDDEDSTEGEEILKHGEAGMTIPTRDIERLCDRDRHQRQQRNQTADVQKDVSDQVMIRFNDSASTGDKDEAGSNVSSEVSIDGDFILETTLLDVNTERLQVTTQSPDVTERIVNSENGFEKSYVGNSDVVPEVMFSQDTHGAVSTKSHGRERIEQLSTKIENERNKESRAEPPSSESLSYDMPEEDSITEIRTIDEKQQKNVTSESSKDSVGSFRPTLNPAYEDYIKFLDYVNSLKQRQQSSYVRFPSNEANSIHSLNYKQNSRYPADDVSYGGTSTKSSVPIRQKPLYYLTATNWKLDRPQSDVVVQTTTNERQNRQPDLIHFWSKIPLIRDPDIYKDDETSDDKEKQFFRAQSSHRLKDPPFTETLPRNRVSMQKQRTPTSVL